MTPGAKYTQMSYCLIYTLVVILLLFSGRTFSIDSGYDPLYVPKGNEPDMIDLTVRDKGREREIPLRVYLPTERTPAPVVLFSHGLGGSCKGNEFLGKHWAARGYVAVFIQHPGSDTSVWKDIPLRKRMNAMRRAANARNFRLRVNDVSAVIDQLEQWQKTDGHALAGRMNLDRIGMSGHSFGAVTTQAVSGQTFGRLVSFADTRIKAAMAFSPSSPRRGSPEQAFGNVKIPWMLMTGTKDIAVIGDIDITSRLAVFPALPAGGKYELVLYNAQHSAFADRSLPGDTEKRNPNHHRVMLALSTAFWDAWLRQDGAAKAWLHGDGPNSVLEKNDRWQTK